MLLIDILSVTLISVASVIGATTTQLAAEDFDWKSIEPSPELRYHPCYDGFRCARLKVPLDWLNLTNLKTVAVAIVTLPATVPENDAAFGGTVVLNPGGPGGSGVKLIRAMGRHVRSILDRNKHYEILSFDPRGVMYTTPRADCFDGDAFGRTAFSLQTRGIGGLDGGKNALKRHLSLLHSFGSLCAETDADADILGYVSTASVARDMVEIIDRVDELRRSLLASAPNTPEDQHPIVTNTTVSSGPARLQYYGLSYGTFLGNTFASMFPGRVGRLMVDGVVNANEYVQGNWTGCLADTEKALDNFYKECYAAGNKCPLLREHDKNFESIRKRVDSFIEAAAINPLPYIHNRHIELLNANDIRRAIYTPLYIPIPGYEELAKVLAEALEGNYTLLWAQADVPRIKDSCSAKDITEPFPQHGFDDALISISCGDAVDNRGKSIPHYANLVEEMKNISETYGEYFSNIPAACSNWGVRPKWRFEGPFTSPPATAPDVLFLEEGRPAAPLLFLSSRLDPATPLQNAYAMSSGHPGSAVVVQESVSHCTFLAGTSECVARIMQDYMEYGVVPENGTVCAADENCKPWQSEDCQMRKLDVGATLYQ